MGLPEQIESEIIAAVLGGPIEPPVDLIQVSADIGVRRVRGTRFPDGFTEFRPIGPEIYLNWTERGRRMRFIFAHELAHVMIRRPEAVQVIRQHIQARLLDDEEELADRIATALLVPDAWIASISTTDLTLSKLEKLAKHVQVSLTTLVSRMSALGIDIGLLHWERGARSWHVIDRPGVPVFLHGRIRLSQRGLLAIERLGAKESEIIVDGHVNGMHVIVGGWGYRHQSDAVQLIKPSQDITPYKSLHSSPRSLLPRTTTRGSERFAS